MTRSTPAMPQARRRTVLGAALLASALLGVAALSACSAGQITQTDSQVAAVPGVSKVSADGLIVVHEAAVAYADQYKVGDTVPIQAFFFNNARQAAKLTGVTVGSEKAVLVGSSSSAAPSPSGSRSASASASPSAAPVGASTFAIDLPVGGFIALTRDSKTYPAIAKLSGKALHAGEALEKVTFTFTYADGTTTTIDFDELPMTVPLDALPKPSSVVEQGGGGH